MREIILQQIKQVSRPTKNDMIKICNHSYYMKSVKMFINALKHHSYDIDIIETRLVITYSNKLSSGKVSFKGIV
jgi:hypothetical protein